MAEGTTGSYATISQNKDKRIMVHSHIPMPSPGTANAPWFDSRDATLFIERFYQMCKDHGLARYCVTWIGEWMKILKNYKEVQANGRLDEFTKMSWFLQGLPEKLQNKIIDKAKLNLSDNILPIDFRKVVQVTMDLIDQYKGNKKIFKEDEMKQKIMEKLGEQYQLANKPPTVEAPKKTASFVKTEESKSKAKAKSSDSTNIEAAIEKMTNKFINLALAMRCYEYQSDMSNGYCHIDDKENLCMGSKNQNYQAVTPKPGTLNMYIVWSMGEDEWVIQESTSPKKKTNQQEETPPTNSTSVKVQAEQLAYLISDEESDSDKEYEPLEERTSVNVRTVGEAKNNQRAKIATPCTQHTEQFIAYWDNQASVDDDVMEDVESINQKKPEIQGKSVEKQRPRYSATDHLSSQICDSMDANELMG
ncbi:conserved hypothetical protein [Coccidioides posadasii str. Silveira]|uniref:Uncharacterized protein n=1 Tax=Coccidioides posadasii (strain RMSCC 757 / Silveira) TaxID=443226 RepID=E9DJK6_COCPS|nr:conserved hypothetical protein [Coccidioides posadasii str. Silveira]